MQRSLNAYRLWAGLGWALLATVITLSLVPVPQPVAVTHADKLEHLLAYGALMYWWGMVQPRRRRCWVVILPLLGLTLEFAQLYAPGRYMEWIDVFANLAGVALGWLALHTPARRLLGWIDHEFFDRADSGLP